MFREMRRKKQLLPKESAEKILKNGSTGVLAVSGDDDYPYAVPLNYVYEGGRIYFHCARSGHKLDAIRRSSKVSFCVVGEDKIVPDLFATNFRSVIAFGRAKEVDDDAEKAQVMRLLNDKYAPGLSEEGEKEIQKDWNFLSVIRIEVEYLTGKEAAERVRNHTTQ
jgi:nitroimidazol reductase NimA-like FMN-containing flavoprotein (pyridoxamine 5'-phosphate oxidase superfamily)